MNIELVARDVVFTDEVHVRVEQKLEKILERTSKEVPVRMMVENTRGRYLAHISMHVKGREIVAQSERKTMLQAIDEAIEKADRQFKKHQDKIIARR